MAKIIAEIGWNHGGHIPTAKYMIECAARAGADYAKFQTWSVKHLAPGPWDTDGRREIYEKAELSEDDHIELREYCNKVGISFLTSCFREADLEFIRSISREIKIPSHEARNRQLISAASEMFETVYLSVGTLDHHELPPKLHTEGFRENIIPMHCVSAYPCPYTNAVMGQITKLKEMYPRVGYSGHCEGKWDALMAIGLGACVIEKHFTTDKTLPGRDNKFSITMHELMDICKYRDIYPQMKGRLGVHHQSIEDDIRNNYAGRWNYQRSNQMQK